MFGVLEGWDAFGEICGKQCLLIFMINSVNDHSNQLPDCSVGVVISSWWEGFGFLHECVELRLPEENNWCALCFDWRSSRDRTISTRTVWWPSKVKVRPVTRTWSRATRTPTSCRETRRETDAERKKKKTRINEKSQIWTLWHYRHIYLFNKDTLLTELSGIKERSQRACFKQNCYQRDLFIWEEMFEYFFKMRGCVFIMSALHKHNQ